MSVPPLISSTHLEARIGGKRLAQLCGNTGDGKTDVVVLNEILQTGSDEAANLLMPGFTVDDILALVAADTSAQAKIAWICIGLAAEGRSEFLTPEGKFLFAEAYDRARKELKDLGAKRERSAAEETTGHRNKLVAPRVSRRGLRDRHFCFTDTDRRRGSGGF